VPTVIVDVDDRRAKILTVNLNELKGQSLPALMAELVHDLSREISLADLESQLPYDMDELEDFQSLLKIPDGLESQLVEEAERMERERPRVLSFAVSREQEDIIEAAMTLALERVAATSRGAALTHLAQTYLDTDEGDSA
jgi:hypothetical protein